MGSSEMSHSGSVDALKRKPSRKVLKNENVESIRIFFNDKTGYIKTDKLSQAYIASKFTTADAEKLGLDLEDLRLIFQSYCIDPKFSPDLNMPEGWWKFKGWKPVNLIEWFTNRPEWLLRLTLLRFLKWTVIVSAIVPGTQVISNISGSERQKFNQSWQVISAGEKQSGSSGRVEALEYLKAEKSFWSRIPFLGYAIYTPKCKSGEANQCLVGIKIQNANLNSIDLENSNLESSEFQDTSFRNATLNNVIFKDANLKGANLKGAKVTGIDFAGAILCKTIMADGTENNSRCKK